ncbi:RHS repeat domain-containing protein [Chitinophaga parva]|uniref:RHS repeat domain-containing protein n=1 Tax=Chitinophaga parva TaxID=2169414 RepID=UPI001403C70F|nr:RHS repeat-associated core domain-containing protein [Chitinophaga parva]
MLRSKDDVFLLYRGWLELQSQQIKEAISQTTALLDRQDTGLYVQAYRSDNRRELLLAVAQFKTEQQDIERKILALTLPDEEMVGHMLRSNYSSGGTQITYLAAGMGFAYTASNSRGEKEYELSNHLGNVMATVRDRKLGIDGGNGTITYYNVDVVNSNDYYPFGSLMPGRSYSKSEKYRYGFNGKENDNEVKGDGNHQDYGMRVYDPRIARFLSTDPIAKSYPELTPYQFASNRPIDGVDIDGKEWGADSRFVNTGTPNLAIENVMTVRMKVTNSSKIVTDPNVIKSRAELVKTTLEQSFKNEELIYLFDIPFKVITKTEVILDYSPVSPDDGNIGILNFDDRVSTNKVTVNTVGNTTTTTTLTSSTPGETTGAIRDFTLNLAITMDGKLTPVTDFVSTTRHEGAHSGGVNHPWNLKGIEKINLQMLDQTIAPFDRDKVLNNFMNSAENPDLSLLPTKKSRDEILKEQINAMFLKIKKVSPFSGADLRSPNNNEADKAPKQ